MFCGKCGKQVEGDVDFCTVCGTQAADNESNDASSKSSKASGKKTNYAISGILNKIKSYLIIIAIVVVICFIAFLFFRIGGMFPGGLPEISNASVVNISNLEHKITSIGELATLQFDYRNVIHEQDSHAIGNWNLPFTQKTYIIVVEGTIKVGIDISDVDVRVSEDTKVVSITLPRARVLSHEMHEDRTEVLEESSGLFNRVKIEDWSTLSITQKQEMEEKISDLDIFARSENDSIRMLKSFIELAIPDDYTVNVTLRR